MPLIEAQALLKEFRVFRRREGLRGAVLDLFHRRYDTLCAVDRVSFRIESGERVGYIGPNGAGKSTTLKMLTGILVPTSGRVTLGGLDPHRDRERCARRLGAVFGQRSQLWWDLAPIESLKLLASIYRVAPGALGERLAECEPTLQIGPLLHTPVRKLSLGQKMRCELAAALLHRPEVIFLDEPTIGLDLMAKEGIRRFLLEENRRRGTTLILTTHDLTDIEELCERVIIIDKGKLLYDGALRELKLRMGGSGSLVFQLIHPPDRNGSAPVPEAEWSSRALFELRTLTEGWPIHWAAEDGGAVRATFALGEVPRAEVIRRVLERFEVSDIAVVDVKIEDVIRRIYQGSGKKEPESR
jgi:ABC-2 type transport system ATP-binding protein